MENEQQTSIFNFELDSTSKAHLQGIAQWAKINAIVAFVSVGISLVQTVVLFSKYGSANSAGMTSGLVGWVISILLNVLLLNASNNITKGLANADQNTFNKGLGDFARYLRVIGIICIVVAVILGLVILFALIFGAARGF
ncbi:MAG: hypothetical protein IPP48_00665 [Chitinophagaceae bacterium]|nr:hypothetical protein [Chitinophagaceae bacterium]